MIRHFNLTDISAGIMRIRVLSVMAQTDSKSVTNVTLWRGFGQKKTQRAQLFLFWLATAYYDPIIK